MSATGDGQADRPPEEVPHPDNTGAASGSAEGEMTVVSNDTNQPTQDLGETSRPTSDAMQPLVSTSSNLTTDTNVPPPVFKMPMLTHRPGIRAKSGGLANVLNDNAKAKKLNKVAPLPSVGQKVESSSELPMDVDDVSEQKEDNVGPGSKTKPQATVELIQQPQIPYKEPEWGSTCTTQYSFEVVKNGTVVDTIDLTKKSYFVFGRLPSCDVSLEHPSLSRHHAIIQHCGKANEKHSIGWYLYDLDSTHGTWTNKIKVKPRVYHRLRVGHVVKFGGSSRLYILQGPEEDQEDEAALSITEMKQLKEKQTREAEILRMADSKSQEQLANRLSEKTDDEGCSWGFDEDVVEDEDVPNPFAQAEATNEDLYIDDPKKGLRGYFEREGLDLPEYEIQDGGKGKYRCMVELPIDSVSGEPIVAEATVSGKKKEAVIACALEACRILDKHGELRKAKHESRARKKKNWEDDDFYDSDDDTFLDRTGTVEKKREKRMKKFGKDEKKVETYESLVNQLNAVENEMKEIQERLDKAKRDSQALEEDGLDALDAYMSSIKAGSNLDTKTKMKLKRQLFDLKLEQQKLLKLVNIAKPAALPSLPTKPTLNQANKTAAKAMPLFGKKKILLKPVIKSVQMNESAPKLVVKPVDPEEEEEEEEEEETREKPEKLLSSINKEDKEMDNAGSQDKTTTISDIQENSQTRDLISVDSPVPLNKVESNDEGISKAEDASALELKHQSALEPSVKKKKIMKTPEASQPQRAMTVDDVTNDPDFQAWVPPTGQTGDGRTHLNEKYGY